MSYQQQATRVDVASATVTYVGKASVGASPADPVWSIFRITSAPTGGLDIEFANGESAANYSWNDRASLTYS